MLAGGGVPAATGMTSSSGPTTLTVCATAAVGTQALSNNAVPIDTLPGVTDSECATTTVPRIANSETTTPATTAPPTTAAPATTTGAPTTTTAAGGTANLWIDPNGGSCTRSSTPVAYNPATSCATMDGAYHGAQDGDLVLVKNGSYGQQKFTTRGTTGWTQGVTFRSENPLGATFQSASGVTIYTGSADWLTFDNLTLNSACAQSEAACPAGTGFGVLYDGTSTTDTSNHVTLTNDDVDVGVYAGAPPIVIHTAQFWTFRDNTMGPACCGLGSGVGPEMIRGGPPRTVTATGAAACGQESCHIVIDHNLIQYDSRDASFWPSTYPKPPGLTTCTNANGCHMDSIHFWGAEDVQITNNRIYGADCNGILLAENSAAVMADYTITGNAISTLNEGCDGGVAIAFTGSAGHFGGTWNIGFNSSASKFYMYVAVGAFAPGTVVNWYGNYAAQDFRPFHPATGADIQGVDCQYVAGGKGPANVAFNYSHNVWGSGTACSSSDAISKTPAWVNPAAAPATGIDMSLSGSGTALGFVNCSTLSVGSCPTGTDAFGNPWPTTTANAGADQTP